MYLPRDTVFVFYILRLEVEAAAIVCVPDRWCVTKSLSRTLSDRRIAERKSVSGRVISPGRLLRSIIVIGILYNKCSLLCSDCVVCVGSKGRFRPTEDDFLRRRFKR